MRLVTVLDILLHNVQQQEDLLGTGSTDLLQQLAHNGLVTGGLPTHTVAQLKSQ